MPDRYPDYSTIPNRIKDPTMTEQSFVAVCAGEPHPKYPLGSEVQLKSIPGFGYNVIAAIKNERSLMAMDGSCLAMALVHEIEPYCDVDQVHFVSKASKVLWDLGAQDFSEIAAKELYKAGARFPDAAPVTKADWTASELTVLSSEVSRMLMEADGYKRVHRDHITDETLFNVWHTDPQSRFYRFIKLAVEIVSTVAARDAAEAVRAVYPHPDEEI